MYTPSSTLPSASRPSAVNAQPGQRTGTDAQQTLANRLAERLGVEPGSLNGKRNDYTPEKVAGRILDFIGQRLESEAASGADTSKLQKLLKQAQEGVEKGFAEARAILDGMGVLKGQVAADIDDTYKRIQDGFADLNQRFGEATPAPSAGGRTGVAAYSERFEAQAETFDLSVTTRDGDRLRISVAQASANWSQTGLAAASDGQGSAAVGSSQSGSMQIGGFQVQVEGELDEEERGALEELFGQVQDISNKFYAGDLNGAFDRAMALDMDGDQLASMSLQLTQTTVRQSTDAYSAVAEQGGQAASAVNGSLMEYAQSLLESLRTAAQVSEDGKGTLKDLLKGANRLDERFDPARLDKADKLNDRLLDGLDKILGSSLKTPPAPEAAA
ncbi:MAG: DUF5610 domain-containing protein [Pseudomonas sp.]|uniref:DUF5610 domain-containing protein n=1 Tax=Pseudomonas sp. TaxID=306 RepID=UPI0033927735